MVKKLHSGLIRAHIGITIDKTVRTIGTPHQVHINFMDSLIPMQIKGRKVPIHIQDPVSTELKALVRDHITTLKKCKSDHFINPIVITAKTRWLDQVSQGRQNARRGLKV